MGGTRFWEFYLVRYLLGTIFGIVILFYLVINYDGLITKAFYPKPDCLCAERDVAGCQSIKKDIESLLFSTTYGLDVDDANSLLKTIGSNHLIDSKKENIEITEKGFPILAAIILAVSGFLYMYFSSMLILILHGLRAAIFFKSSEQKQREHLNISKIIFLVSVVIISLYIYLERNFPDFNIGRHTISICIILVIIVLVKNFASFIRQFYKQLSHSRTKKSEGVWIDAKQKQEHKNKERQDYIESYKHLREHGNAFGIIVCEIIFAMWLVYWDFSYWAIFYWCCAGFLSWFLGSYIEVARVNDGD